MQDCLVLLFGRSHLYLIDGHSIFSSFQVCQNKDWTFHKHECSAIISWMSSAPDGSPPSEAIRSLGRILWGIKVKGEDSPWVCQRPTSPLSLSFFVLAYICFSVEGD